MNPAVILTLVADLYNQVSLLTEENQALRAALDVQDKDQPAK